MFFLIQRELGTIYGLAAHVQQLVKDLFLDYDRDLSPIYGQPVKVLVMFPMLILLNIVRRLYLKLKPCDNRLQTNRPRNTSSRLIAVGRTVVFLGTRSGMWNGLKEIFSYGNVTSLFVPQERVWVPRTFLMNACVSFRFYLSYYRGKRDDVVLSVDVEVK